MATRPQRSRARRRRGGVQWGSFGAGLVLGIGLTVTGALLPDLLDDHTDEAAATAAPTPAEATPRFEFFESLPKGEVAVDTTPYRTLTPTRASREPVEYLLQAGSFANRDDAERLRATVLLTGLAATTAQATLPSGAETHRVMVGPFAREQDVQRAMTKLREQHIDPLLLTRPKGAG